MDGAGAAVFFFLSNIDAVLSDLKRDGDQSPGLFWVDDDDDEGVSALARCQVQDSGM